MSPEACQKMSDAKKGKPLSAKHRKNMSIARQGQPSSMLGKHHSQKTKDGMSKDRMGEKNSFYGKHHTQKTKDDLSNQIKAIYRDPNGVYNSEEYSIKRAKACNLKPNKPEKVLGFLLNNMFPKDWIYTGDGIDKENINSVWIGRKNPDFMNVNGQKKVIELFGDYWHSEKITGEPEELHELNRINHFRKYGFETLIIWEKELKDINKLKLTINSFCK